MLDLASVGPAARTSRWLADYGATVVKVGPTPKQGGVQITPPFYAYAGHRDMLRAQFDLKADAGRNAFLKLAATADVVIESFRPGVVDRLGIGYAAVQAVNPGVVYCSTTGYGQEGPYSQWAGHDLNYLAVGGYLDCSGRDAYGGPALPGATIGDGAGGGMHAVIAILAALVHRGATGEGAYLDVSVADGVLSLMSLHLDEFLATGTVPAPRHELLTGRFACYDVYPCRDAKWLAVGAIEPQFYANLCRALGCEQWIEHQRNDAVQHEIRADFRRGVRNSGTRRLGGRAGAGQHVRVGSRVSARCDRRPPLRRARDLLGCPRRPARRLPAAGAGVGRHEPAPGRGPSAIGHHHGHGRAPARRRPRRDRGRRAHRRRSCGMSTEVEEIPPAVLDSIGEIQYEVTGEFPVERGYIWTSCSSVENGNPLFWDDETAEAITGGPIAPPTMLSVWFRPHNWAPGRTEVALPLQVHFDLKETFGLPEAVMTDNTIVFHEPVRPGDILHTRQILRSVSDPKTTKLGTGRFWVIDVEYLNQHNEVVGVESYTGFGYKREGER